MKLDNRQIKNLLDLVVTSKADSIGCDGCYELMDQLRSRSLMGARCLTRWRSARSS